MTIKELWESLADVPIDSYTECIDEPWLHFSKGAHREDIWHWFEETFGVSVAELMYEKEGDFLDELSEEVNEVNDMTPQEKWEEIYDVLDNMNINYCGSETEALIEFWTGIAGQDIPTEFDYDGSPEDFVKQFTERAENYDVDEEVELYVNMRGKDGVPNTVRELLDDCQEAKDTLMEIARKLQEAIK